MDADRMTHVLASIDGALADEAMPDGMRWHPDPGTVKDAPRPFDGELVWQPPQRYEQTERDPAAYGLVEVEVVFATSAEQRAAGSSVADAAERLREQARAARERGRRPPAPPRGQHYDLLLFDDLAAPPSAIAVRAAAAEARREAMVEALRDAAGQLAETTRAMAEELAPAWARFGADLAAAGIALTPGPPPRDPAEARAAALAARQAGNGAGPRRPGPEQARRPRRHP